MLWISNNISYFSPYVFGGEKIKALAGGLGSQCLGVSESIHGVKGGEKETATGKAIG